MTFPRFLPLLALLLLSCVAPSFSGPQQPHPQPQATSRALTQPAPSRADTPAYTLPPDKLAKAIALDRIRNILDIVAGLWGIAALWLLLSTRGAANLEAWTARISRRPWLQGLVFFAALLSFLTVADLPIAVFGHSVSLAYSISIQGWPGWLGDQAKGLAVTVVLGAPVLLLFHWIVRRWPRRYWFGVWLATLPLMVLSLFVAPLFEPLFNQYEPLAKNHAALVDKLEAVVAHTGTHIPPERMFLMLASQKTNGLNAYVNGIGPTKRIVVWDTTAGRIPDDEVMFVFGHESGHYVLNHIPKMMTLGAVGALFVFWACAGFAAWLVERFGGGWGLQGNSSSEAGISTRTGFVVLILAVTIAGFVLEPVTNTVSRHFEQQADVYGQEAIHGLVADPQKTAVAGFNALGRAYLEDPNPNPIIEFWEYDHPSVKNRANFAAHYNPWANGGHGEFFGR